MLDWQYSVLRVESVRHVGLVTQASDGEALQAVWSCAVFSGLRSEVVWRELVWILGMQRRELLVLAVAVGSPTEL